MDLHYSQTDLETSRIVGEFYYLMDLHYSQTKHPQHPFHHCFTTLWIYTILKRNLQMPAIKVGFTTLWIYTILKLCAEYTRGQGRFTTLWIYTILKRD